MGGRGKEVDSEGERGKEEKERKEGERELLLPLKLSTNDMITLLAWPEYLRTFPGQALEFLWHKGGSFTKICCKSTRVE